MSTDRGQFLALVDAHGPALMSMLRRLSGNTHDADDVFQETALRVWRNFGSRPILRNPRGWLMTIAYRTYLDRQTRRPKPDALVDPPDQRLPSPDRQAEHSEQCDRLAAAIDELPGQIREVVVLHYSGGLTLRQAATTMGISLGTVKSRLNTALVKLRSLLE